jgi:phage-related minor tail protein
MDEQKVVVLHGFTPEEAIAAMRALKAALPSSGNAAFATTTETNMGWKLRDLIEHVAEEHRQFKDMTKSRKA